MRSLSVAGALALLALTACGGTSTQDGLEDAGAGEDAATPVAAAKFSEIYPLIFPATTGPRCSFCHAMMANNVSNGLLETGEDMASAYAALVGQQSQGSACKGKALIIPGDPDNSLFMQKLLPNPPCGSRMPLGGSPLSDAQLAMVRGWIQAGAKDD